MELLDLRVLLVSMALQDRTETLVLLELMDHQSVYLLLSVVYSLLLVYTSSAL